jgi:hypothetical protein
MQMEERLARIERMLGEFVKAAADGKDEDRAYYTTRELAEKLMKDGIKRFKGGLEGGARRVQLWCNAKRIEATKRPSGRGKEGEWMIPQSSFVHYKNFGLLPRPKD